MSPQIEAFDGAIGAAVTDVDLSQDLDASSQKTLIDAWNAHSVLVFRDQKVTPEQLLRFSRYFGSLETHVLEQYLHREHPEVLVVSNILKDGKNIGIPDAGRYWHTDLSYLAEPSRGSILYAIEIPEENGETLGNTLWASTAAAYEALPEAKRKQLEGLTAEYSLGNRFNKLVEDGNKDAKMSAEQIDKTPPVTHPIVRTHPITARKSILVNEGHTTHIHGLSEVDSRTLLEELWAHCTKPEFTYRHVWQPGDVVMWDNVPTQHLAVCDYALPQRRLLHRTTLTGDRPY
ncbi:MAG: TauD/TfdA family dioxygenase [Alphaproteobacteria bacterium]|nr:TauD/TfdA family dioxygenase [Alphaproteobacteria bacterium]